MIKVNIKLIIKEFSEMGKQSELNKTKMKHDERIRRNIEFLTIKQASNLLHMSQPTLKKYSELGLIPRHKIGSKVLYIKHEIEDAIAGNA